MDLPSRKNNFFHKIINFFSNLFKNKNNLEEALNNIILAYRNNGHKMNTSEKAILLNMLKFGEKTVEDIMIPRSDIISANINSSLSDIADIMMKTAHTRILIFQESLDNIVGFLHLKDVVPIIYNNLEFDLNKSLRTILAVAPSMKLSALLLEMQKEKVHIAIIVDGYGGTAGMVTIEDIVEQIVGDIEDEFDSDEQSMINLVAANRYRVNARIEIEELEKELKIKFDNHEDVDTLAGLIIRKAGQIPKQGEIIFLNQHINAKIIKANDRFLKEVELTIS